MSQVQLGIAAALLAAVLVLGWLLKGAYEDKATAEANASTAISANQGLSKSLDDQAKRHLKELADRDAKVAAGNAAVKELQARDAARAQAAQVWQSKYTRLQKEAPDACFNTALPDALFDADALGVRDGPGH